MQVQLKEFTNKRLRFTVVDDVSIKYAYDLVEKLHVYTQHTNNHTIGKYREFSFIRSRYQFNKIKQLRSEKFVFITDISSAFASTKWENVRKVLKNKLSWEHFKAVELYLIRFMMAVEDIEQKGLDTCEIKLIYGCPISTTIFGMYLDEICRVKAGITDDYFIFVDDIFMWSDNIGDLNNKIEKLIGCLHNGGLKLNLKKTRVVSNKSKWNFNFLGSMGSGGGYAETKRSGYAETKMKRSSYAETKMKRSSYAETKSKSDIENNVFITRQEQVKQYILSGGKGQVSGFGVIDRISSSIKLLNNITKNDRYYKIPDYLKNDFRDANGKRNSQ